MLSIFHGRLRITISRAKIDLHQEDGWLRKRRSLVAAPTLLADPTNAPERLAEQLHEALSRAGCSQRAAAIVLADDLVRLMMVTPPHNANRLQDCRAAAGFRFHNLYGQSLADWVLDADWDVQHPFLACAVPRSLLQAVHSVVQRHRFTVVETVPYFVHAWNRYRPALQTNAWIGVVSGGVLSLGAACGPRLCGVRVTGVPEAARQDTHWLSLQIHREALRLGFPQPTHVQLCGEVPDCWLGQAVGGITRTRLDGDGSTPQLSILSGAAQ
jgi:hypothetical protein